MAKSNRLGMKTFDQALFELYEAGMISYEDALRNADSKNEVRLRIKLESKREMKTDRRGGRQPAHHGRGNRRRHRTLTPVRRLMAADGDAVDNEMNAGRRRPRRSCSTPSRCSS